MDNTISLGVPFVKSIGDKNNTDFVDYGHKLVKMTLEELINKSIDFEADHEK